MHNIGLIPRLVLGGSVLGCQYLCFITLVKDGLSALWIFLGKCSREVSSVGSHCPSYICTMFQEVLAESLTGVIIVNVLCMACLQVALHEGQWDSFCCQEVRWFCKLIIEIAIVDDEIQNDSTAGA